MARGSPVRCVGPNSRASATTGLHCYRLFRSVISLEPVTYMTEDCKRHPFQPSKRDHLDFPGYIKKTEELLVLQGHRLLEQGSKLAYRSCLRNLLVRHIQCVNRAIKAGLRDVPTLWVHVRSGKSITARRCRTATVSGKLLLVVLPRS
jgi:hypothetical protein